MIVVDTNVISESIRVGGIPRVQSWLDSHLAETLFVTATTLAELLAGLSTMPTGRRRRDLETKLELLFKRLFPDRLLPFDEQAARRYGEIVARARSSGIAISMADGQIAAIAEARGFAVATRDVMPFRGVGLHVINPWEEA